MITRIFRHSDGQRIAVEIDDGESDLLVLNFDYDPPSCVSVAVLDDPEWTEQDEKHWSET
jgi:hypothetical protein